MEHALKLMMKPDNIPVLAIIPMTVFMLWYAWRTARQNDAGQPDQPSHWVDTWPHLIRIELLFTIACMVILTVWSITIDAPLEEAADPLRQPDPSKAPWYFLGLQELLVYFDPWIAGVMVPLLIIFGLMAIPYLDTNPEGDGAYTWKPRKFAITVFVFGFVVLWLAPIFIGVFFRGPGWGFYWPWEAWEPGRSPAMASKNLSDLVGVTSERGAFWVGLAACAGWYLSAVAYWAARRKRDWMQQLGTTRYAVTAFLFLTMMAIPVKMILRWTLGLKYVWVTPWFNI